MGTINLTIGSGYSLVIVYALLLIISISMYFDNDE